MTATIELTLSQLRHLAKSVSRSIDAEAKKLERLKPQTPVWREVKLSYAVLDEVDEMIRDAMREILDEDES